MPGRSPIHHPGTRHVGVHLSAHPDNRAGVMVAEGGVSWCASPAAAPGLPAQAAPGRPVHDRLEQLLTLLRIDASIHCASDWPALEESGRWQDSSDENSVLNRIPMNYLHKVNRVMASRCAEGTAVTFIQLPAPPTLPPHSTSADEPLCQQYLKVLDELTKDLSPTILSCLPGGMHTLLSMAVTPGLCDPIDHIWAGLLQDRSGARSTGPWRSLGRIMPSSGHFIAE
ncbi:hypothetical protein RR46_02204 [Papilio xuthus]|uniref:Uncharacterized protein n=1 Tax=Papilio xuthus TaxID=66420 RepID=A0A194QJ52_PAPXU|nr:hypothetical protein RR46_02204 [Papilio xuthus]